VCLVIVLWKLHVRKMDRALVSPTTGLPMPGPNPGFLGLSGLFALLTVGTKKIVADQSKFGPVARVFIGPYPVVFVSGFGAYQELLTKSKSFQRGVFYRAVESFAQGALFTVEGSVWKKHRLAMSPFFQAGRIKAFSNAMVSIVDEELNSVPRDKIFFLQDLTHSITSRVLIKMMFKFDTSNIPPGVNTNKEEIVKVFGPWLGHAIVAGVVMPPLARWNIVKSYMAKQFRPFMEVITSLKTDSGDGNLWLELANPNPTSGLCKFTWEEFKTESVGLLQAGFDTTSNTLCWILWAIAKHPHVKDKLKQELNSVLGNRPPTVDDLAQLQYLDKVVFEALRRFGTADALNREAIVNDTIQGYTIPKGTQVFICPSYTVRHAFDRPLEFDPDRFTDENMAQFSKLVMNSFGSGPHECIGKHLALMELRLITARLVQIDSLQIDTAEPPVQVHSPINTPTKLDARRTA